MKIAEVKTILEKYSQKQLKVIITQLYKAIPKAVKEANDIDSLLQDPDSFLRSKSIPREKEIPDIDLLHYDTEEFIEDAYHQYYFIPNQFISKRDRPKWRFIVKRLYKDLLAAASDKENLPEAAQLFEKLYQLLCYACSYILFSGDDPFQSVGIQQKEFFHRILTLKFQYEEKYTCIKNALLLLINNSHGSGALSEDLMQVLMEFLKTPDLKELAISGCNELIETVKKEPPPKKTDFRSNDKKKEKLKNLAEMGFLCYAQLYEYEKAIQYFKQYYAENIGETALYVLLRLLFNLRQKDYFLQEYEKALKNGIAPWESLEKTYRYIKENGKLPEYSI
jgi:hypothetical protein